ncbi:MAG: RNHCP domain-containing protein, partial [Chloroflexota bacterium]|nr:RNHCP domain-containing protein [Chloroflexota bacterium]
LTSRHVDGKRPGDRRSDCGSLMAPVGVIQRRNGEQLILHRCLGCGQERPNRVAADDNPALLLRLPPVSLASRAEPVTEEAIA